MSRSERVGTLAVVTIMTIVIATLWMYPACERTDMDKEAAIRHMIENKEKAAELQKELDKAQIDTIKTINKRLRKPKKKHPKQKENDQYNNEQNSAPYKDTIPQN